MSRGVGRQLGGVALARLPRPGDATCHIALPRAPRATTRIAVLLLTCAGLAACSDATGPDGGAPPGRLVLATPQFTQWWWLPGGAEIAYSTSFNYPYTGPPTHIEAVSATSGERRTIVAAPTDGNSIVAYDVEVVGSHVYYQLSRPSVARQSLLRASIAGNGAPEVVMDSAPIAPVVSPDERTVAWVESPPSGVAGTLVTQDIASGTRRRYPLQQYGDRPTWSPSSRVVVIDPRNSGYGEGTPFEWVDLASGAVHAWRAPPDGHTAESTRELGWEGDVPFVYVAGPPSLVRYNLATGARESLGTLPPETVGVGWSADFERVATATNTCLRYSSGPFGGDCLRWRSTVTRVAWRTGARATVLTHEGAGAILGRLSPDGQWLAYAYSTCGGGCYAKGDGLYVVRVP